MIILDIRGSCFGGFYENWMKKSSLAAGTKSNIMDIHTEVCLVYLKLSMLQVVEGRCHNNKVSRLAQIGCLLLVAGPYCSIVLCAGLFAGHGRHPQVGSETFTFFKYHGSGRVRRDSEPRGSGSGRVGSLL